MPYLNANDLSKCIQEDVFSWIGAGSALVKWPFCTLLILHGAAVFASRRILHESTTPRDGSIEFYVQNWVRNNVAAIGLVRYRLH